MTLVTGVGGQEAAMPPMPCETYVNQRVGFWGAGSTGRALDTPPREIQGVTLHTPCRPRDTWVVSWQPRAPEWPL